MTDQERQQRLRVENRLAELNAKYGAVSDELPAWLDHYPTSEERRQSSREFTNSPVNSQPVQTEPVRPIEKHPAVVNVDDLVV